MFVVETNDIAELKVLIVSLQAEIQRLRAENEELKRRITQNSANSHQPPALDGLTKKPSSQAYPMRKPKNKADNPATRVKPC